MSEFVWDSKIFLKFLFLPQISIYREVVNVIIESAHPAVIWVVSLFMCELIPLT